MERNRGRLGLLFLLLLPLVALTETLEGRVIAITDGDTLRVLDAEKMTHKIRLVGIDAPEASQAYGQASKRSLSELAFNRTVTIEYEKRDRYGRIVGKVIKDGQDLCLEQLRRGFAWHFKKYAREQPAEDRERYAQAEEKARADKIGLWSATDPIPPWEYRKSSHR